LKDTGITAIGKVIKYKKLAKDWKTIHLEYAKSDLHKKLQKTFQTIRKMSSDYAHAERQDWVDSLKASLNKLKK
jgi:hypothetical protein